MNLPSLRLIRLKIIATPNILLIPSKLISGSCSLRTDKQTDGSGTEAPPVARRNKKKMLDRSKIPLLNEDDLDENFISGSGPGGQSVNKAVNCCQLRHNPTGIVVKVHQTRSLEQNRKIARELMVERLDQLLNGENSYSAQKKQLALAKSATREAQNQKRRLMKEEFKKLSSQPSALASDTH